MNTKDLVSQLFYNRPKVLIFFFSTVSVLVGLELFGIVLIEKIVDEIIVGGNHQYLGLYMTLFVFSFIAVGALTLFKRKIVSNITSNVATDLAKSAHESLLKAELSEAEKEEAKEITAKIVDNSVTVAHVHLEKNILVLFEKSVYLLGLFILLMAVKPILCLILFISLPFFYLIMRSIDKFRNKVNEDQIKQEKEVNKLLDNVKYRIRNIKLMNGVDYEIESFDRWASSYVKEKERSDVMDSISKRSIQDFFVAVTMAIILGLGAWLANEASFGMNAGTILVYAILVPATFMTFRAIINTNFHFSLVEKEAAELDCIYSLRTEIKNEPVNIIEEIHSLKFIDVAYGVKPKENIIEGITFELKRGEKLGIISDDICKDTIFEILTKLIKPRQGYISINNCDINKINTTYLRDLVTSIFDYSTIYNDTIMNNIAYPSRFDDYKYNDALNKSGLKELINALPERDNTVVSENCENITKDIMNRIIFANAFYKDSKIFVLNEATYNFDVNTEAEVLNEIFKLKGKIVIMLTDKVYNLSNCDKILIVQEGKMMEFGKYDDLLHDKNSYFYKLLKKGSITRRQKIS